MTDYIYPCGCSLQIYVEKYIDGEYGFLIDEDGFKPCAGHRRELIFMNEKWG